MAEPIICPVCRARVESGSQCRRCKADLSLLFALEAQRTAALSEARRSLAANRLDEGLAQAQRAHELRRDDDSQRLIAAAHLLRHEFAEVWHRCGARKREVNAGL